MTDYLAAARDHAAAVDGATFGSPTYLAHLTAITALASLAIAEALPQGTEHVTGETTGAVTSSPSPAEPSLVALERTESEAVRALVEWRKVDRYAEPDDPQAWAALLRLRDVADRIGGGL